MLFKCDFEKPSAPLCSVLLFWLIQRAVNGWSVSKDLGFDFASLSGLVGMNRMGKNGGKSNLKANSFTALLNLLIFSGLEV